MKVQNFPPKLFMVWSVKNGIFSWVALSLGHQKVGAEEGKSGKRKTYLSELWGNKFFNQPEKRHEIKLTQHFFLPVVGGRGGYSHTGINNP